MNNGSSRLRRGFFAAAFAIAFVAPSYGAIHLSPRVRNAMLDAIESTIGTSAHIQIWSGTMPADCVTAATGTKLADFALASDWAANAAAGAKALNAVGSTTGLAAGNAGYFRFVDSTNPTATCDEEGTVTATGGGGDMTMDNISIAVGQTVNVTGWTWTEPGA